MKNNAAESQFECFIITETAIAQLPRWVRLGKWASKAEVKLEQLTQVETETNDFVCVHPLNPLDVMFSQQVVSYDTLNMPPVSLIRNVRFLRGRHYRIQEGSHSFCLPATMQYRFH